jgi:2-polyprenyl-3-methyl-5-hydroxy-6-metoxy-1,4-benzoquinol methylase
MINAFNEKILEINKILQNESTTVKTYIQKILTLVLKDLNIKNPKKLVEKILNYATNYETKEKYENQLHKLLKSKGITEKKIAKTLNNRADLIFQQIQSYLTGEKILDFGCGDGKVGEKLSKEGYEVLLVDIYKHPHISNIPLIFKQFKQGEKIPTNKMFDVILLLTVLHHSEDPLNTIREAKRLLRKGGRILIIESVYGIKEDSEFGKLTSKEQILTNIFFDHFYNRVIHYHKNPKKKVSVPFNFRTPSQWKNIFEKEGLKQIKVKNLGIDQPTVPEYHTLHILQK